MKLTEEEIRRIAIGVNIGFAIGVILGLIFN